MAEPDAPAPETREAVALRRRLTAGVSAEDERTPVQPTAEVSSWQAQLADARRAMAAKLESQSPLASTAESAALEDSGAADDAPDGSGHTRRVSTASSEGDDDYVQQLLRPLPERCAEPVHEETGKEAGEGVQDEPRVPLDDRLCRICFDGEDEELGKLFSPCLCRGTSRYVHSVCLERWRKAAANPLAFYECGQCRYKYQFRRSSLAKAVTNPNLFVSDHILVGEGIREAVHFVEHQLEESRWAAGRDYTLHKAVHDRADDGESSTSYRRVNTAAAERARQKTGQAPPKPSFVVRAIMHATKGSALLGIVSVFYTYIAATFVSPLGRTLFRALRPAGGRRRAADRAASMSQAVVIFLIVIGILRSIRTVYRGVRWLTKQVLSRIEDLVIEVNAPA
ncbi:hypothetical protein Rhopal_004479-T1 [Rhodotorula paludigena]|uniref:RING-CH-type domain-containing protein n=1 Tax=Rhodotorula paludigena TaxID=86838 RepID=A0AAV5GFW0_9BASI|nr:hypothetical protein Rhopal_004479-T1 [Rhodotorula paludigena]